MKRLFMFSLLVSSLLRFAWAIEPSHIEGYMPLVKAVLEGNVEKITAIKAEISDENDEEAEVKEIVCFSLANGSVQAYTDFDEAPKGSIAIVNFRNPIMKYDSSFSYGTKSRVAQMRAADNHENIAGIIGAFDTPGGSVDGTHEAHLEIQQISKPKLAFVDGLCASAGVWLMSAFDEAYASSETAHIGSIGTMARLVDWRKYDEARGISEHVIYATKSKDKNKTYHDALDGKYDSMIKEGLDPINEIFIKTVKNNLPNIKESALTGKVYLAEKAVEEGLITGIKSFDEVVARAAELGKKEFKVHI